MVLCGKAHGKNIEEKLKQNFNVNCQIINIKDMYRSEYKGISQKINNSIFDLYLF